MASRDKHPKPKVQDLRVYLLKDDYVSDEQVCNNFADLDVFRLKELAGIKGALYLREPQTTIPKWVRFVQSSVATNEEALANLLNKSTSAVLILEAAGRRWAFTFGYGRSILNPEAWVRDFGLKVVLNRIRPDSIRSIDCRNVDEVTLHTRRQASRGSEIGAFGLDVSQDMLRQVTGIPHQESFGRRITRSDGLAIAVPLHFEDLPQKCAELLVAYQDKAYKKHYPFVDRIRAERDPSVVRALNDNLAQRLEAKQYDKMHLAPPEIIDWADDYAFCLGTNANELWHDLSLSIVFDAAFAGRTITPGLLKTCRIGAVRSGAAGPEDRWTLYSCLACELKHNGKLYVLSAGDWFEINKKFVAEVNRQVKDIDASDIRFPSASTTDHEGTYNERAAAALGYLCFDKQCKRVDGNNIEPCDLFTDRLQFVHVKRKTRSATLSHLFAQGVVSAICFSEEPGFRRQVIDHVDSWKPTVFSKMDREDVDTSKFEVVYAIIAKPNRDWPTSLPFFSKLNLVNACKELRRARYKVSIVCIPEVAATNAVSKARPAANKRKKATSSSASTKKRRKPNP